MSDFHSKWNWLCRKADLLLTIVFGITSIILTVAGWYKDDFAIVFYTISIYWILTIILLLYRDYVLSRKARYAEATLLMRRFFYHLKEADICISQNNKDASAIHISESINIAAQIFSLVTGVYCSACIKSCDCIVTDDKANKINDKSEKGTRFSTKTLCRNDKTLKELKGLSECWVSVNENTDFNECIVDSSPNESFWYCNDLTKLQGYKNSSPKWPQTPQKFEKCKRNNAFPYVSTLVVPIYGNLNKSNDMEEPIIGFFCVDSKTRGIFDIRYDESLARCISESLFVTLYNFKTD